MGLGLQEKVVLVLGATQGMGRATANAFGREGSHVAVCARNRPQADEQIDYITKPSVESVAKEVEQLGAASVREIIGDVVDPEDAKRVVREAYDWHGRIDVVVNTVGLCEMGAGPLEPDDWWERSFQSVLMTSVRVCREVVPLMVEQGGGAIILTSAMSIRHFIPQLAHYSTQKVALAHFVKDLAKQYGSKGVRTNAILPGIILSEQHKELRRQWIEDASVPKGMEMDDAERTKWSDAENRSEASFFRLMNDYWGGVTWGDRFGEGYDYANLATFLASPQSGYLNGLLMNVDGGSEYL